MDRSQSGGGHDRDRCGQHWTRPRAGLRDGLEPFATQPSTRAQSGAVRARSGRVGPSTTRPSLIARHFRSGDPLGDGERERDQPEGDDDSRKDDDRVKHSWPAQRLKGRFRSLTPAVIPTARQQTAMSKLATMIIDHYDSHRPLGGLIHDYGLVA
jgi:hypothetical protein